VPPFDVAPIIPVLRSHPFNDPAWLFEPKYDGFRGLVYLAAGTCLIRSKRGTTFKRFASDGER
jgi:ATP-dependent DNA ligase